MRATPAGQDAIPPVTLLENMALMGRDRDGMLPARRPPVPFLGVAASSAQPAPRDERRRPMTPLSRLPPAIPQGYTIVALLEPSGVRNARVCGKCARGGLCVVAPRVARVGKAPAAVRSADTTEIVRALTTYAKLARSEAKGAHHTEATTSHFAWPSRGIRGSHRGLLKRTEVKPDEVLPEQCAQILQGCRG